MEGTEFLFNEVALLFEFFATHAVKALLLAEIDVALSFYSLVELVDDRLVTGGSGAAEAIVLDVELLPKVLEAADDLVAVLLGRSPMFLGSALDLLAMLVSACDHQRGPTLHALVAAEGIQRHGGIGTAHMGNVIDVIKRGGRGEASVFIISVCHYKAQQQAQTGRLVISNGFIKKSQLRLDATNPWGDLLSTLAIFVALLTEVQ